MSALEEQNLETERPLFSAIREENLNSNNNACKPYEELHIPTTENPLNLKTDNNNIDSEFPKYSFKTKKSKENKSEYQSKLSIFSKFVSNPRSKNSINYSSKSNQDIAANADNNFKKDENNTNINNDFNIKHEKNNNAENENKPNVVHKLQKINDQNESNVKNKNKTNTSFEKNMTEKEEKFESKCLTKSKIGIFTFFFFFANKPDYLVFILATLISILSGTSGAVYNYLVGYTIRIFAAENSNEYIKTKLPNILLIYITVAISLFAINYLNFFLWDHIAFKSAYKFKKITIKNLLSQSQDVFDAIKHQELNDYLQKKFTEISGIGKEMGSLIQNLSRIVSGVLIASMISWKLTLVLCAVAPLIIVSNKLLVKFILEAQQKSSSKAAEGSEFFEQTLSNIKFIYASVCFKNYFAKYKKILDQEKTFSLINTKRISFFIACLFFLKYVQFPIAFYFSAHLIFDNEKSLLSDTRLSGGEMSTVIFCSIFIGFQINSLLYNFAALANGKDVAAELLELASDFIEEYFRNKKAKKFKKLNRTKRLKSLKMMSNQNQKENSNPQLNGDKENNNIIINNNNHNLNYQLNNNDDIIGVYEKPEIINKLVDIQKKDFKGKIEFRNVCFTFPQHPENLILNNYSFLIPPGMKIGIIGGSKSGKTTIINLIQRIYEIDSGKILIDDNFIENFKKNDISNLIGYAGKSPVLFNMSISENIIFFRDILKNNIKTEKIKKACKEALANRFIERLKEKYDYTVKGMEENNLSKIQMQKIAIARALLLRPKILVLDEATEFMEISKEKKLIKSIISSNPGMTLILISSRTKSLIDMDTILAIKDSQNYEFGSHQQLVQRAGIYSEYYAKQEEEEKEKCNLDETTFRFKQMGLSCDLDGRVLEKEEEEDQDETISIIMRRRLITQNLLTILCFLRKTFGSFQVKKKKIVKLNK